MEIKNNSISKKVTLLLFTIFFLIGVITFKDYGITVDEEFQRSNGFYWLNYVLSFTPFHELNSIVAAKITQIKGFTLPSPVDEPYYGVVFDLPAAFLEVILKLMTQKIIFILNIS